jgi:hypothetical protein
MCPNEEKVDVKYCYHIRTIVARTFFFVLGTEEYVGRIYLARQIYIETVLRAMSSGHVPKVFAF